MYRKPRDENDPLWTPTPHQVARFEPSFEDRAAAAAMSAKGLFLPMPKNSEALPHSRGPRSRWGKAIANFQAAKPGNGLPGPTK